MNTNQGINEVRGLIMDTVRKANSGHTAAPLQIRTKINYDDPEEYCPC